MIIFLRVDLDDFLLLLDILIFYKDCSHTELVANGVCNNESNNTECNFDGGDCFTSTTTQATTSGKKTEIIPRLFLVVAMYCQGSSYHFNELLNLPHC